MPSKSVNLKIVPSKEEAYAVAPTSGRRTLIKIFAVLAVFVLILVLSIYTAFITWSTNTTISSILICLISSFLGWLFIPRCKYYTNSCEYQVTPVKLLKKTYKNKELLKQAWDKAKHWNKDVHIIHQPRPGYCSYASMNSVLRCVCDQARSRSRSTRCNNNNNNNNNNNEDNSGRDEKDDFEWFIQFPVAGKPMTYPQLAQAWNENIVPFVLKKCESIKDIKATPIDFTQLSLKHFEKILQNSFDFDRNIKYSSRDDNGDDDDEDGANGVKKQTYLIANLNRSTLWFCNRNFVSRFFSWLIGGHLTPIISCIEVDSGDINKEMHVLIGDVNKEYGNYLIPSKRLYQAIKCLDLRGLSRGLIKIDVEYQS